MTTILAHRDTLYADSRCTADNAAFRMCKIRVAGFGPSAVMVACAGETFARELFLLQLSEHRYSDLLSVPDGITIKDEDFSALVIAKSGIWHFDHRFAGDLVDGNYFAIGSGQEAVLGAIECQKLSPLGIQPIRAMLAACQVDVQWSAPPIQWMRYGEFVLHKENA